MVVVTWLVYLVLFLIAANILPVAQHQSFVDAVYQRQDPAQGIRIVDKAHIRLYIAAVSSAILFYSPSVTCIKAALAFNVNVGVWKDFRPAQAAKIDDIVQLYKPLLRVWKAKSKQ